MGLEREKRLIIELDRLLADDVELAAKQRERSPGKKTRVEQLLDNLLALPQMTLERLRAAVPGRQTLVELAYQRRQTDLIGAFDGFRARGLRDVLHAIVGRGNPRLRQDTVDAADPAIARHVAPAEAAGGPAGQAMWRAAERRATTLYRHAVDSGEVEGEHPIVDQALARIGSGQALPAEVRRKMEEELDISLERVRIHTDPVAAAAARTVRADAFTVGEDIFFAPGTYAPETREGRKLLAHELTHVVQSWQGRTAMHGRVSSANDSLEHEAEAVATRVVEQPRRAAPARRDRAQAAQTAQAAQRTQPTQATQRRQPTQARAQPTEATQPAQRVRPAQPSGGGSSRSQTMYRRLADLGGLTDKLGDKLSDATQGISSTATQAVQAAVPTMAGARDVATQKAQQIADQAGGEATKPIADLTQAGSAATTSVLDRVTDGVDAASGAPIAAKAAVLGEQGRAKAREVEGSARALTQHHVAAASDAHQIVPDAEHVAATMGAASTAATASTASTVSGDAALASAASAAGAQPAEALAPIELAPIDNWSQYLPAAAAGQSGQARKQMEAAIKQEITSNRLIAKQQLEQLRSSQLQQARVVSGMQAGLEQQIATAQQAALGKVSTAEATHVAKVASEVGGAQAAVRAHAATMKTQVTTAHDASVVEINERTARAQLRLAQAKDAAVVELAVTHAQQHDRVGKELSATQAQILAIGAAKAIQAKGLGDTVALPYTDKKLEAAREAAKQVAAEYAQAMPVQATQIAAQVAAQGPGVAADVTQITQHQCDSLDQTLEQTQQVIEQGHAASLATAATVKAESLAQIDQTESTTIASLDAAKATQIAAIRQQAAAARTEITHGGQAARVTVTKACGDAATGLTAGASKLVQTARTIAVPDLAQSKQAISAATSELAGGATDVAVALRKTTRQSATQLGDHATAASEAMAQSVAMATTTQLRASAEQSLTAIAHGATQSISEITAIHEKTAGNVGDNGETAIQGVLTAAHQTCAAHATSHKTRLAAVLQSVQSGFDQAVPTKATADMQTTAANAAASVKPWWRKALAFVASTLVAIVITVALMALVGATGGLGLLLVGAVAGALGGVGGSMASNAILGNHLLEGVTWKTIAIGAIAGGAGLGAAAGVGAGAGALASSSSAIVAGGAKVVAASLAQGGSSTLVGWGVKTGVNTLTNEMGNATGQLIITGKYDFDIQNLIVSIGFNGVMSTHHFETASNALGDKIRTSVGLDPMHLNAEVANLSPEKRADYDAIVADHTSVPIKAEDALTNAKIGRPLTAEDRAAVADVQAKMATLEVKSINSHDPHQVQMEISFDGTWDARDEMAFQTNPALLNELSTADAANRFYEKGVGTSAWTKLLGGGTGLGTHERIEAAYQKIVQRVNEVKTANPNAKVVLVVSGFSRGSATARAFVNELNRRGVPDLSSKQEDGSFARTHETPRLGVMVLFDTVASIGVPGHDLENLDLSIPRNAENVLHLVSRDEQRVGFELTSAVDPSRDDPRITELTLPGAHSDIGGSYPNAYSRVSLQLALDYLAKTGVQMKPNRVPVNLDDPALRLHESRPKVEQDLEGPDHVRKIFPSQNSPGYPQVMGPRTAEPVARPDEHPDLATELHQKTIAPLRDSLQTNPGFQTLSGREQAKLLTWIGGRNQLAQSWRDATQKLLSSPEFVNATAVEQTKALHAFIETEAGLPRVVAESGDPGRFDAKRRSFTVTGATEVKDFKFETGKADALRYDVTIGDRTVPVYFPAHPDPQAKYHTIEEVSKGLAALPPESLVLVTDVYVEPKRSPDDAFWAKKLNLPDRRATMATGGDDPGRVNIYPFVRATDTQAYVDAALVHETGHTVSDRAFGKGVFSENSKGWKPWRDAIASDGVHASNYATKSPSEDFSETLLLYHSVKGTEHDAELREWMPARFKILDSMLTKEAARTEPADTRAPAPEAKARTVGAPISPDLAKAVDALKAGESIDLRTGGKDGLVAYLARKTDAEYGIFQTASTATYVIRGGSVDDLTPRNLSDRLIFHNQPLGSRQNPAALRLSPDDVHYIDQSSGNRQRSTLLGVPPQDGVRDVRRHALRDYDHDAQPAADPTKGPIRSASDSKLAADDPKFAMLVAGRPDAAEILAEVRAAKLTVADAQAAAAAVAKAKPLTPDVVIDAIRVRIGTLKVVVDDPATRSTATSPHSIEDLIGLAYPEQQAALRDLVKRAGLTAADLSPLVYKDTGRLDHVAVTKLAETRIANAAREAKLLAQVGGDQKLYALVTEAKMTSEEITQISAKQTSLGSARTAIEAEARARIARSQKPEPVKAAATPASIKLVPPGTTRGMIAGFGDHLIPDDYEDKVARLFAAADAGKLGDQAAFARWMDTESNGGDAKFRKSIDRRIAELDGQLHEPAAPKPSNAQSPNGTPSAQRRTAELTDGASPRKAVYEESISRAKSIDQLAQDRYGESGLASLSKIRSVLGKDYEVLIGDPGIVMRLDDFLAFAATQDLKLATPWQLRDLYSAHLGMAHVFRGVAITEEQAAEMHKNGMFAGYLRPDASGNPEWSKGDAFSQNFYSMMKERIHGGGWGPISAAPEQPAMDGLMSVTFQREVALQVTGGLMLQINATFATMPGPHPILKTYIYQVDIPTLDLLPGPVFERFPRENRDELFAPFKINPNEIVSVEGPLDIQQVRAQLAQFARQEQPSPTQKTPSKPGDDANQDKRAAATRGTGPLIVSDAHGDPDAAKIRQYAESLPTYELPADKTQLPSVIQKVLAGQVGDVSGLTITPLGGGGLYQGYSGAAIFLVKDATGALRYVAKVTSDVEEATSEVSGLTLLANTNLEHFKSTKSVGAARLLGADGKYVIVSVAEGAPGKPLVKLAEDVAAASGGDRAKATAELETALDAFARGLAELHDKAPHVEGDAAYRKHNLPDADFSTRRQQFDEKTIDRLAKNRALTEFWKKVGYGSLAELKARIQEINLAAVTHPGSARFIHGDTNPGNEFYAPDGRTTWIDAATVPLNVNEHGQGIGPVGRDITSLSVFLEQVVFDVGLPASEAIRLRTLFEEHYRRYRTDFDATSEADSIRFFELRAALKALEESPEVRAGSVGGPMLEHCLDMLARALGTTPAGASDAKPAAPVQAG